VTKSGSETAAPPSVPSPPSTGVQQLVTVCSTTPSTSHLRLGCDSTVWP
jgi:hypothetical protein